MGVANIQDTKDNSGICVDRLTVEQKQADIKDSADGQRRPLQLQPR